MIHPRGVEPGSGRRVQRLAEGFGGELLGALKGFLDGAAVQERRQRGESERTGPAVGRRLWEERRFKQREVGAVASFTAQGKELDADKLESCNG